MASHQIKFLDLLQNQIAKFGSIKTDDLYEPPFTTLQSDSYHGKSESYREAAAALLKDLHYNRDTKATELKCE